VKRRGGRGVKEKRKHSDVRMLRPSTGLSPLISAQMEKRTGHYESIFSSSMIIPKKLNQCTISTNIFETMKIRQNDDKDDDNDDGSLPMLPSTGQPLEHSAARDRIQLKNRKHTASQLKINEQEEDHCTSLTISQPNQHSIVKSKLAAPFSLIDLSDLQTAANNLRQRTRERSVDNLLLSTMPLERSKRSESTIFLTKTEDKDAKHPSSPEHIYDNFDLFKHSKNQSVEDLLSSKVTPLRECRSNRLRPVTMFVSNEQEKLSNNEFDDVFNQFKKRSVNRKVQPDRDVPRPIETVFPLATEKKPIEETLPSPSWIDIAKQKQTKFQTIYSDIYPPKPSNNEPLDISSPTNERIRPTRTGTSSRINSLIQFFNK